MILVPLPLLLLTLWWYRAHNETLIITRDRNGIKYQTRLFDPKRVAIYLAFLEEGYGSRLERLCWSLYHTVLPSSLRHHYEPPSLRIQGQWIFDKEGHPSLSGNEPPYIRLPFWFSWLSLLWWALITLVCLWCWYEPIVLLLHSLKTAPPLSSQSPTLDFYSQLLDSTPVHQCLTHTMREPGSYCVTQTGRLWRGGTDSRLAYPQGLDTITGERDYYTDAANRLYYPVSTVSQGEALLTAETLVSHLESLRLGESVACVCPVFLGILDNMTLLYDYALRQWLVMLAPAIEKNNTVTPLIESTLEYTNKSGSLHHNYHQFVVERMQGASKFVHYATFHVAYSVLQELQREIPGPNQTEQHTEYTNRILTHDTVSRCINRDDPDQRTLLLKAHPPASRTRRNRVLSGEEAICFSFCDATNKALPPYTLEEDFFLRKPPRGFPPRQIVQGECPPS